MTGIYYLLGKSDRSQLHQFSDTFEMWHFYDGDPIYIVEVDWQQEDVPQVFLTKLGNPIKGGEHENAVLQHVIPSGRWLGAVPCKSSEYALVGCSVSPGFTFSRFRLCDSDGAAKLRSKLGDEIPKELNAILP